MPRFLPLFRLAVLAALCAASSSLVQAGNWPQWRGPRGDSVSGEIGLPVRWSEDSGVVWKASLPEWGTSSPSVWDNALFVTTEAEGKLLLLRFDAQTGDLVWTRQVGAGVAGRKVPDGDKRAAKFHELHNLASPTAALDGERVIVHFGNGDLASYSFDGDQHWKRNLADDHGRYTIWWGHANSPLLYQNLVISVCMQDSLAGAAKQLSPSYLVAHDKQTGDLVWKTPRMTRADAEECDSYTTPVLHTVGGQTQMIVMGGNQLDAYDPATGQQLWHLPGLVGGRTITGPTVGNDTVFATVGMRGPLCALNLTPTGPSPGR